MIKESQIHVIILFYKMFLYFQLILFISEQFLLISVTDLKCLKYLIYIYILNIYTIDDSFFQLTVLTFPTVLYTQFEVANFPGYTNRKNQHGKSD